MSAHLLTIDGVTRTVPQWAREKGISRQLLRYRVRVGKPQAEWFAPPGRLPARIKEATVIELRRRVAAGESVPSATAALGVSQDHGRRIAQGLARKGVPA